MAFWWMIMKNLDSEWLNLISFNNRGFLGKFSSETSSLIRFFWIWPCLSQHLVLHGLPGCKALFGSHLESGKQAIHYADDFNTFCSDSRYK